MSTDWCLEFYDKIVRNIYDALDINSKSESNYEYLSGKMENFQSLITQLTNYL